MNRRWYPRQKPPTGAELWKRLQEEIDLTNDTKPPVHPDSILGMQYRLRDLQERHDSALELISRSANIYLRYFRMRHRVLLWWRRHFGPR